MGPKKKPATIQGDGFKGREELNISDFRKLAVEGFNKENLRLLLTDWSGEVIGVVAIALSNDNRRVTDASFHLMGNLCTDKRVSANKYWDLPEQTSLSFSIPDCAVFKFTNGNMVSELLDGGSIEHSFYVGEEPLEQGEYPEALLGFTIRAHVIPTRENYAKLNIILFPLAKDLLLTNHPLSTNPTFPGISVFSGEIPVFPSSATLPLSKNWGCPVTPMVLPGMDLEDSSNIPKTPLVRAAIAQLLMKAVKPDAKASYQNLLPRWMELIEQGASKLKDTPLELIWPVPSVSNESFSEGRDLVVFKYCSSKSPPPLLLSLLF